MDRTVTLLSTPGRAARRGPATLLGRLMALAALRRSRRQLGRLDRHLLRDVGLSPEDARREAESPLWNAPAHWLR